MRRHLCAVLAGPPAARVRQWRLTWDPVMAAVVPPHVTVTYPEEIVDENLLLRRARSILRTMPSFRLRLGEVFATDAGQGGVFVAVHDIDGGWTALRQRLLADPMTAVDFPAHVTVAHPRTCAQGPHCYTALAGHCLDDEFDITEVLYTETTAGSWTVRERFPLDT